MRLKLKVGFIADAAIGPFRKVEPGSTLTRLIDGQSQYNLMWTNIGNFYAKVGWSELSRDRLEAECDRVAQNGLNTNKKFRYDIGGESLNDLRIISATPKEIMLAVERWNSYGWVNYEEKKQDKLKGTGRVLKWGALLGGGAFGFDFFGDL